MTKNKKNVTLFSEIAKAVIQATDELNFTSPVITITGFGIPQLCGFWYRFLIHLPAMPAYATGRNERNYRNDSGALYGLGCRPVLPHIGYSCSSKRFSNVLTGD